MGTRPFKRKEGDLSFSPSNQERMSLTMNYHVTHYLVKMTVTHTNGTTPVFNENDLFDLVNKIEIVANGNKSLKSIRGTKLLLNTILAHTEISKFTLDTTASTAGLTSFVYFIIPFNLFGVVRPHDTILNTGLYNTLDMLVDWGSAGACGSDITVTDAKMEVFSNTLLGYKRNAGESIKFYKEIQITEPITNDADEHLIKLPTLKKYMKIALLSTVDGVKSDLVVENVILKSGESVIYNLPWEAIQVENELQYAPKRPTELKGIAILDFIQRGRLTDVLDTFDRERYNSLELLLKVKKLGTKSEVQIFIDELEVSNVVEK